MKKHYLKSKSMRKNTVQGATLIEVLVSVFLLTFGILGLMATQLRSVAAVSESENQSIAALAAENLAEAMQSNATLNSEGKRQYNLYLTKKNSAWVDATEQGTCKKIVSGGDSVDACRLKGKVTKEELAAAQIKEFEHILKQMPNIVDLKYVICAKGDEPTLTETKCTGTGLPAIKILWTTQKKESDNPLDSKDIETQFYQLELPQ